MSIGGFSGTHFENGIFGSRGLYEDVPIDVRSRRDVIVYFNDFLQASDFLTRLEDSNVANDQTAMEWSEDDIGAAAGQAVSLQTDELGGVLLINAGTANSTGIATQLTGNAGAAGSQIFGGTGGEFLALDDNVMDSNFFAWEARVKVDTVANGALLVGLLETDTTAFSTAGAVTVDNGLYFVMNDGGGVDASAERATNVTSSTGVVTMANDAYVRLGMRGFSADVSSATANQHVLAYVNGVLAATLTDATNGVVPNVGLCPTFAAVNDAANDIDARVDYFWCAIERD